MSTEPPTTSGVSVLEYNRSHFTGLRSYYHYSRFHWLRSTLQRLGIFSGAVLELGCMDGKTLDFLPFVPDSYYGFDAEPDAIARMNAQPRRPYPLAAYRCTNGSELLAQIPAVQVDVSISMETLEHVDEAELDSYLVALRTLTRRVAIITVPKERGVPFFVKHGLKKLLRYPDFPMTASEFLYSTIGRMNRVRRLEHRGFDYLQVVDKISGAFSRVSVEGVGGLPLAFAFTIGIVAQP